MLTIKKRGRAFLLPAVFALASLTACGPPGARDLRQGQSLIDSGRFAEAVPVLTDGIHQLQGSAPHVQAVAWNMLGMACQGAGQLESASKAYLQALKLDRNLWAADFNMGCLRLQQTNYSGAIDSFTTFTTANQKDAEAFLLLGRARVKYAAQHSGQERARQLDAARKDYQYSDQLRGSAEACNALGLLDLQRRLPRIDPVEAALHDFNLALQRDPHYAPAILNIAIVLQRYANQPQEALKKYREYVALQPAPANAKDVAELARQLDLSLRISIVPHNASGPASSAPPATNGGPLQKEPSRQDETSQPPAAPVPQPQPAAAPPPVEKQKLAPTLQLSSNTTTRSIMAQASPPAAKSAAPENPPAEAPAPAELPSPDVTPTNQAAVKKKSIVQKLNPLSWFSTKDKESGQGQAAPAGRYQYPVAVTPIPGDRKEADRLVTEGRQLERSNRAQAIQSYENALKADPTDYDAAIALGLAAINEKDYATALDGLNEALTLQKDSADARYAFAWVLDQKGYFEDAANELNKLLASHPNEARGRILLGNIYADNLAEPKLAREQYQKALPLIDPKSSQAAVIQTWLQQHQ